MSDTIHLSGLWPMFDTIHLSGLWPTAGRDLAGRQWRRGGGGGGADGAGGGVGEGGLLDQVAAHVVFG